jgi:hypothetical protein
MALAPFSMFQVPSSVFLGDAEPELLISSDVWQEFVAETLRSARLREAASLECVRVIVPNFVEERIDRDARDSGYLVNRPALPSEIVEEIRGSCLGSFCRQVVHGFPSFSGRAARLSLVVSSSRKVLSNGGTRTPIFSNAASVSFVDAGGCKSPRHLHDDNSTVAAQRLHQQ